MDKIKQHVPPVSTIVVTGLIAFGAIYAAHNVPQLKKLLIK